MFENVPCLKEQVTFACKIGLQVHTDEERSVSYRNEGNSHYKQRRLDQARRCYNEAIRLSSSGESAALAFANRSSIAFEEKDYEACIADCQRALARDASLDIKWRNKVKHRAEHANELLTDQPILSFTNQDELYLSENEILECCSSAVEICHTSHQGRHLKAKEYIPSGALLLRESPLAGILADACLIGCDSCGRGLPKSHVYCPLCAHPSILYCNDRCRINANLHHQWECRWLVNMKICANDNFRLVLRVLLRQKPTDLIQCDPRNLESAFGISFIGKHGTGKECYRTNLKSVMSLTGSLDEITSIRISAATQVAIHYLSQLGYFHQTDWPCEMIINDRITLAKEYLKALYARVQFNCYEVGPYCQNGYSAAGDLLSHLIDEKALAAVNRNVNDIHGIGLYPVQSLLNHSCAPTTSHYFDGFVSEFRTAQCLQPGDEITTEYGEQFGNGDTESRRKRLLKNYGFMCTCIACVDPKWQKIEMSLISGLRCQKSYDIDHVALSHSPAHRQTLTPIICTVCNNVSTYDGSKVEYAERYISKMLSLLTSPASSTFTEKMTPETLSKKATEQLTVLECFLHECNRNLQRCRFECANILRLLQYKTESIELYRKSLTIMRDLLPRSSTTLEFFYSNFVTKFCTESQLSEEQQTEIEEYARLLTDLYGRNGALRFLTFRYGVEECARLNTLFNFV